jgi:hypothetical protein
MQREQDLTVRARPAIARWWPVRALAGRALHMKSSAAHGGAKVLLIVTTVCAQIMLGCGDERPPWSGFPIFPDAGGFELSPELASGLLAAQAAFARQLAEQAAPDAGQVSSGTTGPVTAGRATAGSEAPKAPPPPNDNDRDQAESDKPSMAADPAPPAKPADTRRSTMPRERAPADAGIAADGAATPQLPAADGGMPMPSDTTPVADSGTPSTPSAGSAPPPPPDAGQPQPPTPDAGTPPSSAGSGAPATTEDAGTPTTDADGGN